MSEQEKIEKKILSLNEIKKKVSIWKRENKKIVFTNGCFDIIHKGHITYLASSKDLGDKLIIGLNSDSSISCLKGEMRPLQDETSRAMILASLFFVDTIVLFSEQTPYNLIKEIKPDILVKGADYKKEDIVGYDILSSYGGEVKTLKFLEGYSTTNIIKKIQGK
ncbi:MAG: D-glycero-beta-D-manno-heptose 1-phosphate adenylyltransferase [Bacteroidales bacterium]|jgi:rfaE bifunctional protein nucleotidyltransferase chain/domain|nr:D-glycero-beta-D-manno-heptose 1-phosphate adenylyltransferase [Bacteroidales bacterium]